MESKVHLAPLRSVLDRVNLSRVEVHMEAKFDIFKQLRDGTSIWITAVDALEEARNRINRLSAVGPGDYLVYSEEKGLIVERVTTECCQGAET